MEKINFLKLMKQNDGRGYGFYDCGFAHKHVGKYLNGADETLMMTREDMYKNKLHCYGDDIPDTYTDSNSINLDTATTEYNENNFVIDLDDIWDWLGFQQKAAAKKILVRNFLVDIDYKITRNIDCKKGSGGHNKELILMNVKTFNLFCLKGDTIMSGMLHEYYIKLERALIGAIDDEYTVFKKNTQLEGEYTKSLDELIPLLTTKKDRLSNHLVKNYKENYHYIIEKSEYIIGSKAGRGGHNKVNYMLTEYTFELLKNSYNLRNKYITNISDNVTCVNVGMCIENQTIGFIENAFKDIIEVKRQYMFGKYKVDLYFPEYNLVVECDEYNHADRNPITEKIREDYILSLGNNIIRFNPNEKQFDLSNVLKDINKILFF